MKKLLCILILLAIAFSFGCDRYPDGPLISFRSVQKRLEGTWQIVGFTSNGVDSLQNFNDSCGGNMQISFPPDWDLVNIYFVADSNKPFKGNEGSFYFSDHFKIMNVGLNETSFKSLGPIDGSGIGSFETWKILKLEMKKLKISTNFNGRNYIISFNKET